MSATEYPSWDEFMRTSFAAGRKFPMVGPEQPTFMGLPLVASAEGLDLSHRCAD